MMEAQYKPKGWLGLIMGTRMYYSFHGDDSHGPYRHLDAPYYILYGETVMKYSKAGLAMGRRVIKCQYSSERAQ
jgi:hypothetical protein